MITPLKYSNCTVVQIIGVGKISVLDNREHRMKSLDNADGNCACICIGSNIRDGFFSRATTKPLWRCSAESFMYCPHVIRKKVVMEREIYLGI